MYNCICQNTQNEDLQSIMSNLQPNCCLKIDFQKVDQHTGGKWLIHDSKRRNDNQLQSLKFPRSFVARCDIKGSDSTMLNPTYKCVYFIVWRKNAYFTLNESFIIQNLIFGNSYFFSGSIENINPIVLTGAAH